MGAKECPMCGHPSLVEMEGAYRIEPPATIPGGAITVGDAKWLHCGSCGEDILSPGLEASIEAERRRRLGLLTPTEIRDVREMLRLSIRDLSELLGVGQQTYERWENGRSLPTPTGNTLLRQMAKDPETFMARAAEREANGGDV